MPALINITVIFVSIMVGIVLPVLMLFTEVGNFVKLQTMLITTGAVIISIIAVIINISAVFIEIAVMSV